MDGEAQIEKTMVVNTLTPAVMKNNQRHSDKLLSSWNYEDNDDDAENEE